MVTTGDPVGTHDPVYLEDLTIGQVFTTGAMDLTADSIIEFAQQFDPQPMHLSDEGAAGTIFQSLTASGWHITALTMRLMVDSRTLGSTPLIGAEIMHVRFAQPARPGMRLTAKAEVTDILPGTNPARGFAMMAGTTLDQHTDEIVMTQSWRMLLPKRPS